jgi:hypothetical protein
LRSGGGVNPRMVKKSQRLMSNASLSVRLCKTHWCPVIN